MALEDTICTLVPYFTVQDGKLDEFKALGGWSSALNRNPR